MKNIRRLGIALMLATIMVLSIFAILPSASAAPPPYKWRDYEYPIKPSPQSALFTKMIYVDMFMNGLPSTKSLADQGIFHEDFLVSYLKIGEFLYRSCDPDLWLFHKQMYVQSQLYGNYPGDSSKPVPQAAVSQAKKIFQDEFVVLGELNNEIRKLSADYDSSTGMNQMIIGSYMFSYKSIRSNLVYSDMKIAFNLLSNANEAVDEIENSNGKVDLSAFGGPSDFTIENQKQFIKWTGQANDDFDSGVSGLGLSPSDTRTKLKKSTYIMISTDLDDSAYTSAMKSFEKVVNKAGHALAMSGIKDVCASTIALAVPAVIGIVLCAGVAIRKRRNA